MNLLERMKVASDSLTLGERFLGSLQVTLFGITIVFVALFFLFISITIMEKVLNAGAKKPVVKSTEPVKVVAVEEVEEETMDDTELVAVITAAIAASLQTSTHNIVVRNIVRVPDTTPAWGQMGRMEQIHRAL